MATCQNRRYVVHLVHRWTALLQGKVFIHFYSLSKSGMVPSKYITQHFFQKLEMPRQCSVVYNKSPFERSPSWKNTPHSRPEVLCPMHMILYSECPPHDLMSNYCLWQSTFRIFVGWYLKCVSTVFTMIQQHSGYQYMLAASGTNTVYSEGTRGHRVAVSRSGAL